MSYISAFERNTRDTLAISVLNKFRRWLLGRDKQLAGNKSEIVAKAVSALNGNIDLNDTISYYFKDSGEINNSVVFQLSKVFLKVLDDKSGERQKFRTLISDLLKTGNPEILKNTKDEFEFVKDVVERSIDYIDNELAEIETSSENLLFETKGF